MPNAAITFVVSLSTLQLLCRLYLVNTGTSTLSTSVNLLGWGVGAGTPLVLERVAAACYGEVTDVLNATSSGVLSVVSGTSVMMSACRAPAEHLCRAPAQHALSVF